jgi:hypothetical protein
MGAAATVTIPPACNGPADSGNGGYSSGAIARHVDAGAVEVTLRRPVPLGVALAVERLAGVGGEETRVLDGEGALVAHARPADAGALSGLAVPGGPVPVAAARAAMAGYRGPGDGPLCTCFVCGRRRADAIGVQAGPVAGRDGVVASTWTPPAWTAGADGRAAVEHVWAVLDCPTYFAAYHDAPDPLPLAFLGRFTARINGTAAIGEEHVVVAWRLGIDGRKREAAAAVLTAAGTPLATARALLIEPRAPAG